MFAQEILDIAIVVSGERCSKRECLLGRGEVQKSVVEPVTTRTAERLPSGTVEWHLSAE